VISCKCCGRDDVESDQDEVNPIPGYCYACADQKVDLLEAQHKLFAHEQFLNAYDAWALSEEHTAGPLFDAMLAARDKLLPENKS